MRVWRKIPAVRFTLLFATGIVAGFHATWPLLYPALVFVGFLIILLVPGLRHKNRLFGIVLLILVFLMGWIRVQFPMQLRPGNDLRLAAQSRTPVTLEGCICAPVDQRSDRCIFPLRVDSVWISEERFDVHGITSVVLYDSGCALEQGDRVVARGTLRIPGGARNPGGFDYRAYLAARGIHSQFIVNDKSQVLVLAQDQDGWLNSHLLRPSRNYILALTARVLTGREKSLLDGLILGVRGGMDEELQEHFRDVGVIHVLAVSGLHVGFVAAFLWLLIHLLRIPHQARLPILWPALFFYALLTGAQPPVVRAAIMAALLCAAPFLQRRVSTINLLAVAALIILLRGPLDLFNVGFQLSFAATAGIVLLYERLTGLFKVATTRWQEQGHPLRIRLLQLALVSAAAQLATLPLTAFYFNRIPIWALPANLLVVPLVSVIVFIGFIAIFAGAIWMPLGALFLQCDWLLLKGLLFLVARMATFPGASWEVPTPSIWGMAVYFCGLAFFLTLSRPAVAKKWLFAALVLATAWIWSKMLAPAYELKIIFFDAGQGDAALIRFPNGRSFMIDCGDLTEQYDCGKHVITPALRHLGIRHLDAVFISHAHSDHSGGLYSLIRAGRVHRIIRYDNRDPELYRSLDSLAFAYAVPVERVRAPQHYWPCPGAWLTILHPRHGWLEPSNENNGSMVMRLQFGERIFLFLADVESEGEEVLLQYDKLVDSDVVKVAHHGSPTASTPALVSQTSAQYAVVSVGRNNRFHLPAESVLQRWQSAGTVVLRTDEVSAVQFRCNGHELHCETAQ